MKLVKGVITTDEDENITMSKDTFYEMDNNFNIILKENKQLKSILTELEDYINNSKQGYIIRADKLIDKIQELKEKYK